MGDRTEDRNGRMGEEYWRKRKEEDRRRKRRV